MTLERAFEVVAKGFAACKGLIDPYVAIPLEGGWLLRDGPGRKVERMRELMVYAMSPVAAVETARLHRAFVCAYTTPDDEARTISEYKALGMRLHSREGLFVGETAAAPEYDGPIARVRDEAGAAAVAKFARTRQIMPKHLVEDDAPIRLYAAFGSDAVVGMVRSVRVGDAAWVSNLSVRADQRGQGLGRALMSAMLRDDARLGIRYSVLLASPAGARLYPHLAYERIGAVAIFTPVKRR